jgi:predicted SAM-dependent methyltransferase
MATIHRHGSQLLSGVRRLWAGVRLPAAERIIIGAGRSSYPAWYATNVDTLDVTRRDDFVRYWEPGSREAFLAEHVWEHLTESQAARANANCYEFLRAGGWLRIAVPDGLHPDPGYRGAVAVGGHGCGADDHKVLYDYRLLREMLQRAGFHVVVLEYWDEHGEFHHVPWSSKAGHVRRSRDGDRRNQDGVIRYTSLIVDALKPGARGEDSRSCSR